METRGPYRMYTKGMPDWEREYWFQAHGEIESEQRWERMRRKLPPEELGPALKLPLMRVKRPSVNRTVYMEGDDINQEYYHQAHATRRFTGD